MSHARIAASVGMERMPLQKSEKPSVQLMASLVATVVSKTIVQPFAAARTTVYPDAPLWRTGEGHIRLTVQCD